MPRERCPRAANWVSLPKQDSRRKKEAHGSQPEADLCNDRHKVDDARKGSVNESQGNMLCLELTTRGW